MSKGWFRPRHARKEHHFDLENGPKDIGNPMSACGYWCLFPWASANNFIEQPVKLSDAPQSRCAECLRAIGGKQ